MKIDIWSPVQFRPRVSEMLHAGDESISLTRNGHEKIVLVRTLAKRSSEGRNLSGQVVLVYCGVRPDAVQQLILTHEVVSVFEQDDEHVEGLRRDGHETTLPPQLPLDGIDDERTEGIAAVSV